MLAFARLVPGSARRYKAYANRGRPLSENCMTDILILLNLPEPIRNQYRDRLRKRFPGITIELVDHHSKVGPYIDKAEVLITFAPMLAGEVLAAAARLKWVQALGTGVDNLIDQPALRKEVIVTNMRGIQGIPVSEAALAGMMALARGLRRAFRAQDERQWRRFPAQLLHDKTVGIFNGRPEERRLHCHGQGYDLVERPLIRQDEPMSIERHMNIVVHPTYIRGRVLSWVCDNYLIGPNGPGERLHRFPEVITELG
jgi:hypothetical protein